MSKILKTTSEHLDQAINLLKKEIDDLTTELDALTRARDALAGPRTHVPVGGRYRVAPNPQLRGKTQKKAFAVLKNRGPMTAIELSKILHVSKTAAAQCIYGMKNAGILAKISRGKYGVK